MFEIAQNTAATSTPQVPAGEEAQKVFAGNLAFSTAEDELKTTFSEAGNVTHVQIISRGTRSLGYGFVTFSTEAEAQKAIQLLNKKEIGGREISVEGAKPHNAAKAKAKKDKVANSDRAKSTRGKARNGASASRRPRTDEGEEGGAEPTSAEESAEQNENQLEAKAVQKKTKKTSRQTEAQKKKLDGKKKQRQESNRVMALLAAEVKEQQIASGQVPQEPTANGSEPSPADDAQPKKLAAQPSNTVIFIGNLPATITDEALKELFAGYKLTSAYVVNGDSQRTKRYGFVNFGDEAEQKRAIEAFNEKEIEGRTVSARPAVISTGSSSKNKRKGRGRGKTDTKKENEGGVEVAAAAGDARPSGW